MIRPIDIIFAWLVILTGLPTIWYKGCTEFADVSDSLHRVQTGLLACTNEDSFTMTLDNEIFSVECMRIPTWKDYTGSTQTITRKFKWEKERRDAFSRLRILRQKTVGW